MRSTPSKEDPLGQQLGRYEPAWTKNGAYWYYGSYRIRTQMNGGRYMVSKRNEHGGFADLAHTYSHASAKAWVESTMALELEY